MKRFVVSTFLLALIVTGLAAVAPAGIAAAPATAGSGHIGWGRCKDPGLRAAHAQCGYLAVPLDYSNLGGRKIRLAVSRVRHTSPDSQYQGLMLVNPGGPGGSGTGLAILGQFVPHHAGDAYDWIGFDPRGVGDSKPSISCIPNYFHGDRPPYVPRSRRLLRRWVGRSQRYARACAADAGTLLDHMKTTDSARDMDSIRRALGADQISFYGFSYGTYLGQVYATLFPEHVRRMVLDSNVDPRTVWHQANLNQDIAFQRNIYIWFGWLARHDDFYHLGSTTSEVAQLFFAQERRLRKHPAGGVVGSAEFDDAFLYAAYYQFYWTYLGDVLAGWVHDHDVRGLIGAYQGADGPGNDNFFAVYLAVECTDAPWPSWSRFEADNWRTHRAAPFFTWGNAWFNAPCIFWHADAGQPVDVRGDNVPVLLIDETLDAPTPYGGSLEVRRRFHGSRLIAEPGGTTHAGSLFGNACVDNKIANFLATGALPTRRSGVGADVICQPLPQPDPTARTSRALRTLAARLGLLPLRA